MSFSRRLFITTSLLSPAVLRAPSVGAQDYPVREIHVICAYAPGTGADTLVRFLAEKLRVLAGKPMIVENKPGAGTSIAAQYVARAKPDGYTLFLNPGKRHGRQCLSLQGSRSRRDQRLRADHDLGEASLRPRGAAVIAGQIGCRVDRAA